MKLLNESQRMAEAKFFSFKFILIMYKPINILFFESFSPILMRLYGLIS